MGIKKWCHVNVAVWGLILLAPSAGQATDFYTEPWELRFAVSMDRQSNYPSTLARHASVAFPAGTSRNPAADDWGGNAQSRGAGSVALVEAPAQSGALIQAIIGAVNFRAGDAPGTWSLAFARTDTLNSSARNGFHNEVESNELFLGYSRQVSGKLSWGIQGRLLGAELLRESALAELGGLPGRVQTKLSGADIEAGLLGETESGWLWGVVAGLGVTNAGSDVYNLEPLPLPVFPFALPPGTRVASADDDILGTTMRLGVGRRWAGGGVYSDVHYVNLATDRSGSVAMGRLSVGVEQSVSPAWIARGGVTADTIQKWSWGAGISYGGWKGGTIDFGYQYDAAPEMKLDLGRVHLFSISAAWAL